SHARGPPARLGADPLAITYKGVGGKAGRIPRLVGLERLKPVLGVQAGLKRGDATDRTTRVRAGSLPPRLAERPSRDHRHGRGDHYGCRLSFVAAAALVPGHG